MGIVVALDVHRNQITYKALDGDTGELRRGRIAPATRSELRAWLGRFAGDAVEFVLEGTTGWRFVVEEIERAGHRAHLADPAETAARRGRKRRAKTDNADCDLQLRLLLAGELPESWSPPAQATGTRFADGRGCSSSNDAVRHAGLDITVYQSDAKRAPGHLSHEGPELLRWALYEAAVSAARAGSPDHAYYLQVAQRLGHTRACLSVARKLCRRAHHLLRELGAKELAPIEQPADEETIAAAA